MESVVLLPLGIDDAPLVEASRAVKVVQRR